MKPRIFSDWNMTLINQPDDKPVLKQIGMDELGYSLLHGRFGKVMKLASLKKEIEKMVEEYRGDPESHEKVLRRTYELYGNDVIPGIPMIRIHNSVGKYAKEAVKSLDGAFYELLLANDEQPSVIITNALNDGVHDVAGRGRNPSSPFLLVDGSSIRHDNGIATGFQMRNYTDKHIELGAQIRNPMIVQPGQKTVYMGNDFRDEPCAEVADFFVVAPLATDGYRQMMAGKYGSKVRTPSSKRMEVYDALTMD